MKNKKYTVEDYQSAEESVQNIHNFYLIVFVYVVMMIFLHWMDLKDGSYDWAYWVAIGFTGSLIWFAIDMLPFRLKEKLIQKELKKNKKRRDESA